MLGLCGDFSPDPESLMGRHEPGIEHEAILELNYHYNITSWLYVQPDIQGVLRPNGTGRVPNALVLAAQLGVIL